MRRSIRHGLLAGVVPPLVAAVAGNAFVGRDALSWFRSLVKPRLHIPLPAFLAVGAVYYVEIGVVLYRADLRNDRIVRWWGWAVMAGNELWNAAFFGTRSPRNGFWGLILFLFPLLAFQRSVRSDRRSMLALTPYTLWVLAFDLPWTYRLWRLNPKNPTSGRPTWT